MIKLSDFCSKQVINMKTGEQLGFVDDFEITVQGSEVLVTSIVIKGKMRGLGVLGRGEDIVIPVSAIEVVGEDTILFSR